MILAKGVEGQRSEHCHELGRGPQGPTNTWRSNLRHVHLQDRSAHPGPSVTFRLLGLAEMGEVAPVNFGKRTVGASGEVLVLIVTQSISLTVKGVEALHL